MVMKKYFSLILIFCLLSFTVLNGCKKSTPSPEQPKETGDKQAVQEPVKSTNISKSLQDTINSRTSWNPILNDFYGKEMPDFQVTDITGKTQKLSDYRGKNVIVVFWATWCMPCMEEVPHLNTLRDVTPEDKLAILAISNEDAKLVKKTAESKKMKYTVIATKENLPKPFSDVKGIPTAFFIRPDGTLKVVTEGSSYFGEMKSILAAE